MSTTFDRGNYVFQCDAGKCRETLDTGTSSFEAARNLLRLRGWKPRRQPGADEWRHLCPDCLRKFSSTPAGGTPGATVET